MLSTFSDAKDNAALPAELSVCGVVTTMEELTAEGLGCATADLESDSLIPIFVSLVRLFTSDRSSSTFDTPH